MNSWIFLFLSRRNAVFHDFLCFLFFYSFSVILPFFPYQLQKLNLPLYHKWHILADGGINPYDLFWFMNNVMSFKWTTETELMEYPWQKNAF